MAPPADGAEPAGGEEDSDPQKPSQLILYVVATLIVGVLTAIGITGPALQRLIRNAEQDFVIAVALAMIGVLLPLAVSYIPVGRRRITRVRAQNAVAKTAGAVLVSIAVLSIVFQGVSATGLREMPRLALEADLVAATGATPERVAVSAEATASSLRVEDKILLRVVAIRSTVDDDETLVRHCRGTAYPWTVDPQDVTVLAWKEQGPSADGSAVTTMTTDVASADVRYICAIATLSNQSSRNSGGDSTIEQTGVRITRSIIDLRTMVATPLPAPSTPATVPAGAPATPTVAAQ